MTVVIDTNVLPGMFTQGHPWSRIFEAWLDSRFVWAVSTEILFEYEETLVILKGLRKTQEILRDIATVGASDNTLLHVSPSFQFLTITADRDDDKFADCAITAQADYIVTSDRHFASLTGSGYEPKPITPGDFIRQIPNAP